MTEDFISEPKEYPSTITVDQIREQFFAAGLPCHLEHSPREAWVFFEGRTSRLVLTLNAAGLPITAEMVAANDYDAEFACVIFDVFDSFGWSYEES
jgi:hypothetical protein